MDKQKGTIVEMYHLKSDLANELYYKQTTDEYELDNPLDIASVVIDLGYRKIPENAVVLTRKEYDELTLTKKSIFDMLDERDDKARKETAEKFAEKLKLKLENHTRKIMCEDYQQGAYVYMVDSTDIDICIDEICKEIIGVPTTAELLEKGKKGNEVKLAKDIVGGKV